MIFREEKTNAVNYKNHSITKRAQESPLWEELGEQRGNALPILLERYLFRKNWKQPNRKEERGSLPLGMFEELAYLHLLLADAVTVLLGQEERIRELEAQVNFKMGS